MTKFQGSDIHIQVIGCKTHAIGNAIRPLLSYSIILRIMKNWAFPAKNITLKPASISLHDSWAGTAKPKNGPFQNNFFKNFSI